MVAIQRNDPAWERQVGERIVNEYEIHAGARLIGISTDGFSVDVSGDGRAVASVTLLFDTDRAQVERILGPLQRPQEEADEEAMARAQDKLFGPAGERTAAQEADDNQPACGAVADDGENTCYLAKGHVGPHRNHVGMWED